jgi:hypothetical protein
VLITYVFLTLLTSVVVLYFLANYRWIDSLLTALWELFLVAALSYGSHLPNMAMALTHSPKQVHSRAVLPTSTTSARTCSRSRVTRGPGRRTARRGRGPG